MKEKRNEQKQNLLFALRYGGQGETKVFKGGVYLGKLIFGVSKIKDSVRVYPYYFKRVDTKLDNVAQIQNDLVDFVKMVKENHFYIMPPSIESGMIGYKTKTGLQQSILIHMVAIFHDSWKAEKKVEVKEAASTERMRITQGHLTYSIGDNLTLP